MLSRSAFLKLSGAAALASIAPAVHAATGPMATKPIPKSKNGEQMPVIGLGTNRFGQGGPEDTARKAEVLKILIEGGGKMIDTAEGYGESERVIGEILAKPGDRKKAFLATKIGKEGKELGIQTMEASFKRLQTDVIDLMYVHNLRDTFTHLPVMREWKTAGRFRYIGISHSQPEGQEALYDVMAKEDLDFIQLNYSVDVRGPEKRLLPLAKDRGIAIAVNLPLGRGKLLKAMEGKPVPEWATKELGAESFAQLLLKYVISHPAVTLAIPGTTTPKYMADNVKAGMGPLATEAQRKKIEALWSA